MICWFLLYTFFPERENWSRLSTVLFSFLIVRVSNYYWLIQCQDIIFPFCIFFLDKTAIYFLVLPVLCTNDISLETFWKHDCKHVDSTHTLSGVFLVVFLKLINNSSPVYFLVFDSIEKIYQTFETVLHRLSKQLEFRPEYSAAHRIFNSVLCVWKLFQTVSRVWYITSNTRDRVSSEFPNTEKSKLLKIYVI